MTVFLAVWQFATRHRPFIGADSLDAEPPGRTNEPTPSEDDRVLRVSLTNWGDTTADRIKLSVSYEASSLDQLVQNVTKGSPGEHTIFPAQTVSTRPEPSVGMPFAETGNNTGEYHHHWE